MSRNEIENERDDHNNSEQRDDYGREVDDQHFDDNYYYQANPDVKQSGMDAYEHFNSYGRAEHRTYKALGTSSTNTQATDSAHFDYAYYYQKNSDVLKAGIDAFEHYERHGKFESREHKFNASASNTNPTQGVSRESFDEAYYYQKNPDVLNAGADAYSHYAEHGAKEHREYHEHGTTVSLVGHVEGASGAY